MATMTFGSPWAFFSGLALDKAAQLPTFATALAAILACAVAGSGCAFKGARYEFLRDKYRKYDQNFDVSSIELSTARFLKGRLDVAGEIGGVVMETLGSIDVAYVDRFSRNVIAFGSEPQLGAPLGK